jgi:hypothetical protein
VKLQPYEKAAAGGIAGASLIGLVVFGGAWTLAIAVLFLLVGAALGTVAGAEAARRDIAEEMNTLSSYYSAAVGALEVARSAERDERQRAEQAEEDLRAIIAENEHLRARLDERADDAA